MENDNAQGAKKAPLVKRIKVPTVRKEAPAAQPAQRTPAPAPAAAAETKPAQNEPAVSVGDDLPPDDSSAAEKPSARRRNRNGPSPDPAKKLGLPGLDDEKKRQIVKAKAKAKRFMSGFLFRLFIIIVLIAIAGAGVYSALPTIAEKKLPELFAANGLPFHRFKLKELTTDTMELTNISDRAGKVSIASMKFNYSLIGLYSDNTIRSLTLSNVTLTGERRNDGISLGVLDDFIKSPINAKKGMSLSINSLTIQNGTFLLRSDAPPETFVNANGDTEEIDNTIRIKFSATGSLGKTGLNLKILTDYESPQIESKPDAPRMVLKTETFLNKTALNSQIKTEITEGNVMNGEEKAGSVTGKLEIAVENGVLSTGSADLLLLSSSQKLKLNARVVPKDTSFDMMLDLDRSFDNPRDAVGKFVGLLSLKANDVTVKGTFQKFSGNLPLRLNAPTLTNGRTSLRDMTLETDLTFTCAGMDCSASLKKPLKFSFSSMQTAAMQKQVSFFKPLDLTINPDPKEPFLQFKNSILSLTLPAEGFQTQLQLADDKSSAQMAVALNGLKARVKYNVFTGAYSGDAAFQQSQYADKNIRMGGVQGMTSFNSNGLPEARLLINKASLTTPNILPDFSANVYLRPQNKYEYGINSNVLIQNGLMSATINGSYSLASHECDFYVTVPKFTLAEDGMHLKDALPFLARHLNEETFGSFAAKGRFAIKDGRILGPMNVLLENVNTSWQKNRFSNLNGVLTFSSMQPLETPANQLLYAELLDTGLPFQNALFNFQIQPDKGIDVANVRMKYADAQFKSIKSFTIPFNNKPSQILLEGNGINLSMISNDLKSSALQMDGILNSEWHLSLTENKELNIDKTILETKMPGTLHFAPPKELQAKMNPQMLDFLKDVIVKNIKLTLKGPMDGQVTFDLSLTGHSPLDESETDQDIALDFKGSFNSFLKHERRGYADIPPEIMQALQNFKK